MTGSHCCGTEARQSGNWLQETYIRVFAVVGPFERCTFEGLYVFPSQIYLECFSCCTLRIDRLELGLGRSYTNQTFARHTQCTLQACWHCKGQLIYAWTRTAPMCLTSSQDLWSVVVIPKQKYSACDPKRVWHFASISLSCVSTRSGCSWFQNLSSFIMPAASPVMLLLQS
jgi:hypothetical protein